MKLKRNKEEIQERTPDEKTKENKDPPEPISTKRLLISLLIKIAAIALAIFLVFTFVLGIKINYGNNMHPAVNDGDLVVSLKLQRPYLNAAVGAIASEDIYYPTYQAENSTVSYPYTVEEGKAFILNDYREDTNDSRAFGAVDMSDIEGPIILSLRRRGF